MDAADSRAQYRHAPSFYIRNLMAELGMPTDADWVRVSSDGPFLKERPTVTVRVEGAIRQTFEWAPERKRRNAWHGYGFELFGVRLDYIPHPELGLGGDVAAGPFFWTTDAGGRDAPVRIWLHRVLINDSPLRTELVISPGKRRRGSIQGLELEHSAADTRRAANAEGLLWELEATAFGAGRQQHSGHWRTPEAFRAEVDPFVRQLRREGKAESRQHVAEHMPTAAWQRHGQTVSLHARVRRLERATKKLLKMTWDEYTRTVK
jgi:hypothetical protein